MSEWKQLILGDMGYTYGGLTNKTIVDFGRGKPFIPYMNIFSNGKINPKQLSLVKINAGERQNTVKIGDLFFTTSSETVEEVGMTSVLLDDIGEAYLNSFCFGFRLKNFDDLLPEYAPYLFRGFEIRKKISLFGQGSTRYNLPKTELLLKLQLNIPPLPHQRKIARILTTVDSIIEKTEAAIAKYKAIKQGMMHDLFSRGIDVTTGKLRPKFEDAPELYKETELGWIPKEWEVKPIELITDYVDYRGKTPPKSETGIFLVTAKNIKMGNIDYEVSKEYIPEYAYQSTMARGEAIIGDVLITTEAPLGNVAQVDTNGLALAQRVIKYRGKNGILINRFLKYSLMSDYFQRQIHAESTGSTVKGIKGSRLHKQHVLVPNDIDEQEQISGKIVTQENQIKNETLCLEKLEKIKSGLMQDLLTGKKEVTPDPEDYKEIENYKVEAM